MGLRALALLTLLGCSNKGSPELEHTAERADTGEPVSADLPCDPALALTPEASTVNPNGFVQFIASGGTGAYQYSLATDTSGATLNDSMGAYVADDGSVGTDLIKVTDAGCVGEAQASVVVVADLEVAPTRAEVPPGTAVVIQVSGGSGETSCALEHDDSGAALDATCAYTAGSGTGTDVVRVTDAATGQYADVIVLVDTAAELRVEGYGRLFVPEGARFAPTARAGSGSLTLTVLEGDLEVEGGEILETSTGSGTILVQDAYADLSAEVPVTVVPPIGPSLERDGEMSGEGTAISLGDIDGDGYADAAFGYIEASVTHYYSGAVMVYRGDSAGLQSEPALILAGAANNETFGRGLAVADVDQDGLPDLLAGADRLDYGDTNNGAVHVFPGLEDGLFDETPSRTLYGQTEYERLGSSIAVYDLDADGWPDLISGAVDGADDTVAVPADQQGTIHVFRGSAEGYEDKADFTLFGVTADGAGGWEGQAGMHLGTALKAGDLDGDGLGDLVAGGPDGGIDEANEDGVVLLYQGTSTDGLMLTREPVGAIVDTDGSEGELGRRLAVGDLDGDGRDDLAVAQRGYDSDREDVGAVWVWLNLDLDALSVSVPLQLSDASWHVEGDGTSDYVGSDVDIADLDSDGNGDLIVGTYRAESSGLINNGFVYVYSNDTVTEGGYVYAPETEASVAIPGPTYEGRFGQAVAGLPDPSGEGEGGLLVLAGQDPSYGTETGAPYYVAARAGATPALLELPGEASGHAIGAALGLFDIDGDSRLDLLVGAPDAGDPDVGCNAGQVVGYAGTSSGFSTTAAGLLGRHPSHSSADRFGYALASGDFNGDGYEDLAVGARKDSRPSSFSDSYVNPSECADYVYYAGSVHIYLGGPSGLEHEPAFAWFNDTEYSYVYELVGGFDHDGDGYEDLLIASQDWTESGGVALVYGQPEDSAGITVLCDYEAYHAEGEFDRLGASAASLGDLDGDGCDDVAVGATGEELGGDWYNQGILRVLWGWGGADCPSTPTVSTATLYIIGTGLGSALDAGQDVDGDGVSDLVVGASTWRSERSEVGGFWVVPGSDLLAMTRQEMSVGALPLNAETDAEYLLPLDGLTSIYGVKSELAGSLFGESLALIPDPLDPTRAAVAVGMPQGDLGGTALGGGVAIYRWDDTTDPPGLDDVPWGILGGESFAPGELGLTVVGEVVDGRSLLLVGAPTSSALGLEVGAAYVLEVE